MKQLTIRPAVKQDLQQIMPLFEIARRFMVSAGNANQWIDGYPQEGLISEEIVKGHCFVIEQQTEIVATFCLIIGKDPTYDIIEEGEWLNELPYGTVHRLASNGKIKGIGKACFDWCFEQIPNIRVDTHKDNKVMQRVLETYGFQYCGIIYTHNGTERLAYQLMK